MRLGGSRARLSAQSWVEWVLLYSLKLEKLAFDGTPDELRDDKAKLKELFL